MRVIFVLVVLALFASTAESSKAQPISKVIELLDDLKAKIVAEGEVESEQFEKYTKWCTVEADDKEDAIKFGTSRVEALSATIEELTGTITNQDSEIQSAAGELGVNEKDLAAAKEVRSSENADFVEGEKELVDAIDQIVAAKTVLKKQLMLAQTKGGSSTSAFSKQVKLAIAGLSTVLEAASISVQDRKKLAAFVEASQDADDDDDSESSDFLSRTAPAPKAYESHSKGIFDVLDDLKEKAEKELAELRKKEMNSQHAFELLAQSLNDDIERQTATLDELKNERSVNQEALGQAKGDLASTSKTLAEDKAYFKDLNLMCQNKSGEWEMRQKSRAEELKALEEAKAILSGEGLNGAVERRYSLTQLAKASSHAKSKDIDDQSRKMNAADFLDRTAKKLNSVGLAQLAARFRAGDDPFGKVKGMISEMIERLMMEEANEADHKQWCDTETGKSKKARDKHSDRIDVITGRIEKAEAATAELGQDIAKLQKEVAEMNASEQEATKQRQDEKTEFDAAIKDYTEAQEALQQAIQVLTDYYGSQKEEAALVQSSEPKFEAPVFSGEYEKQSAGGIIGLLEVAQSDFSKMEAEARADEEAAARDYRKLVNDNAVTRATKEQDIKGKTSEKARLENALEEMKADRTSTQKELDAVIAYLEKLKGACEHAPMTFEERQARRRQEIEALQEALAILSGEDIAVDAKAEPAEEALVQIQKHH